MVEHRLGHPVRKIWTVSERAGERERLPLEIGARMQCVVEAPGRSFSRAHRPTGIEKLRGTALANDPRQNSARAHVRAGEPDAGEEKRGLRSRRCDA